ncbi:MAG TPA: immunoglobulin domain-containing protein, partial [Phycisphaerae bacterium]|nr:immunoglobulin domain-containing protein [Phycisphaerae bacterium]
MSRWLSLVLIGGVILASLPLHVCQAQGLPAVSADRGNSGSKIGSLAGFFWKKPLKPAFQRAAVTYKVPVDLMLVLADQGSGLNNRGSAPSIDNGFGVMGLKDNQWSNSLAAAAALLKVADVELLKVNPHYSIFGAAALLDRYATEAGIDRAAGLEAWLPVIIRYAGLDDECSRIFARSVYRQLQVGLSKTNNCGEKFKVAPQTVDLDLDSLLPAWVVPMVAPTDCGNPDYVSAIWDPAPSCNYNSAFSTKDTVIVHVAEGSAAACINTFKNCANQVSAQYVIDYDGTVYQMVCEKMIAWHVPCENSRSIGLEHAGYTANTTHPEAMYQGSANLVRDMCNRWGMLKEEKRTPPGILAHSSITEALQCGSHMDPGQGWAWDHYIALINQQSDPYVYIVESRSGGKNYSQYSETGTWFDSSVKSRANGVTVGIGTRGAYASGGTPNTAVFRFTPASSGQYQVFATWPTSTNATSQGEFRVTHAGGTASTVQNLNSSSNPAGQNWWNSLGTYTLNSGIQYTVTLTDEYYKNGWVLRTDAVKWKLIGAVPPSAPTITQHPSSQSVAPGSTANFTVVATGTTPLTYQWQKNSVNVTNGGHYSGCTTATLTVSSVDGNDVANYRCVVTNVYGNATSNQASLSLQVTYVVESRSGGQNYNKYSETGTWVNSSGKSTASGCTAGIGHRYATIGSTAGKAIFSFTPTSSGTYEIFTTNGSTTNSGNPLVHRVFHSGGSTSVNVCQNSTCTPNPCNQWRSLGQFSLIGSTAYKVELDAATTAGSGPSGNVARSDAVRWVSVSLGPQPPAITQHPTNQTVAPGATATFTVQASGDPTLTYQWQKNAVNITNGGNISGAATATLQISNCSSADQANYRCVVTSPYGSATSNAATLTVQLIFIVESRSGGLNYASYTETGTWSDSSGKSTAAGCTAGIGHRYCTIGSVAKTAVFRFTPAVTGSYEVFTTNVSTTNSGNPLVHKVTHAGGTTNVNVCQNSACSPNPCNTWR